MLTLSFRFSKKKMFATLAAILVVCATGICVKNFALGGAIRTSATSDSKSEKITSVRAENNAQRLEFLKQFGWEVAEEPTEIKTICIPKEFDDVYINYNEIQKHQGFDLEKFKGKSAKVYTYIVENYPDCKDQVYIHMLVYKSKVIGGDVSTVNIDGFMHGFSLSSAEPE